MAVTHALAAQIFYRGGEASVLDIRATSAVPGRACGWHRGYGGGQGMGGSPCRLGGRLPRDVAELWTFVAALDPDSRMALFAHCASLTVNVVRLPSERSPCAIETRGPAGGGRVARHDAHWDHHADLSRARHQGAYSRGRAGGVSDEAAEPDRGHEEAGHGGSRRAVVGGTGWLPVLMRTDAPASEPEAECRRVGRGVWTQNSNWPPPNDMKGRGRIIRPRSLDADDRQNLAARFPPRGQSPPGCWHHGSMFG